MQRLDSRSRQPLRWRSGACAALASVCFTLAACDNSSGTAPGAVSEGEARALEDAASMLEERRLPDGVIPDPDSPVAIPPEADEANGDSAE